MAERFLEKTNAYYAIAVGVYSRPIVERAYRMAGVRHHGQLNIVQADQMIYRLGCICHWPSHLSEESPALSRCNFAPMLRR